MLMVFVVGSVCVAAVFPQGPQQQPMTSISAAGTEDRCFRELQGEVEECKCNMETVNVMNDHLFSQVSRLMEMDFFKFYKVNLNTHCPFWPEDGECRSKQCAVSTCTDEDLPLGLKIDEEAGRVFDCGAGGDDLAFVNHTINADQRAAFESWQQHDAAQETFCEVDDESNNGVFVNLLDNPERFTGYIGSSPGRIWRAMYSENCFKPDNLDPNSFLTASVVRSMCIEKRVFYRVVSGLHACINLHVAASYPIVSGGFPPRPTVWGPNVTMFDMFFDPQRTWGEGPSRLRNMYFTYLLLLRALVRGAPLWQRGFHTGDAAQDVAAQRMVNEVIAASSTCATTFDESLMFSGQSAALKEEFSQRFKNISRIMDCVGCEKCRMWGKVQIQGLGAAMKILFSKPGPLFSTLRLKRNEVVAFFATFARFSQALHELDLFRQLKGLPRSSPPWPTPPRDET